MGRPGQASIDEHQLKDQALGAGAAEHELERILAALPTVTFAQGADGWSLGGAGAAALEDFAEVLNAAMPSMYRPKLVTAGWDGSAPADEADNRRCGSLAKDRLLERGVTNEIAVTAGGNNPPGTMRLDLPPWERDVQQWPHLPFNMVAHEVGHMLGLNDEYGLSNDEGHGMTSEQEALTQQSGAARHEIDADTSSVMSQGKDVLPAHYVTLWEALGRMTTGYLAPTDWQL